MKANRKRLHALVAMALASQLWQTAATAAGIPTYTVTSTNDSGSGSLRAAIISANGNTQSSVGSRIEFHIPITPSLSVPTIRPTSALPIITAKVVIDGETQPAGFVEIDGTNAGAGVDGLYITGGNTTVKALVINRFTGAGIHLSGAGNNTITGNYIGTDVTGTKIQQPGKPPVGYGNNLSGITIGAPNNQIGNNVISGNLADGVLIGTSGNTISTNYIGTDSGGTLKLGNAGNGILINSAGLNNRIGGEGDGPGNFISGNGKNGVSLLSGANGNIIQGNTIGANAALTGALGNALDGILIAGGANNTVIGNPADGGNIISGNARSGIQLGTGAANASLVSNTVVQGNAIGTNRDGTLLIGNLGNGINLANASNTQIGGAASPGVARGNRIAGQLTGIHIGPGGTGNLIQGNEIRNNSQDGVYIDSDVVIQGNEIRDNGLDGILVFGTRNVVGVSISNGTVSGTGNTIFRNRLYGVDLSGDANRVQGTLSARI